MPLILITGAGGFIGRKLATLLLKEADPDTVTLHLADISEPPVPPRDVASRARDVKTFKVDLTAPEAAAGLLAQGVPGIVYCMHGVMSKGSEEDFEWGLKVNMDSTRYLLAAVHKATAGTSPPPKFIFTSSIAVFGGPYPTPITTMTCPFPQGAYGAAKQIDELLVDAYTRRNYIDGRIVRLPTVVVRPGPPSNATSAFISGIIREPLAGEKATCPIGTSIADPALEMATWVGSTRTVVGNIAYAKDVPAEKFAEHTRVVNLPGFTVTFKEEIEALEKVGGKAALDLITFVDDPVSQRLVKSWPAYVDNSYALSLGFRADNRGIEAVIREYLEDEVTKE